MAWTSKIAGFVGGLASNFLFWVILVFVIVVVGFLYLYLRKKRKLVYPAIEFVDVGDGKLHLNEFKAGWFKSKTVLFGLFDYAGEEVLRLSDGRRVQGGSSEDFHEIFGKRGLLVQRKGDDPDILVPIIKSKLDGKSKEALMSVAPSDFRDASNQILSNNEAETVGKWDKIASYIALGVIAVVLLVAIIVIIQGLKATHTEAVNLVKDIAINGCNSQAVQNVIATGAP